MKSLVLALAFLMMASAASANVTCAKGPEVQVSSQCDLVRYFRPLGQASDDRVRRLMGLQPAETARSIAVVIGVSEYPNLNQTLPSVRNDVRHLYDYLTGEGKFDEVIVLENKDASRDNIQFFLSEYIARESQLYNKHLRVLFAYSGHGYSDDNKSGAITLAGTTGEADVSDQDSIDFDTLRSAFQKISSESFHFLAMINACYAAALFAPGVNPEVNYDVPEDPGGYAYTAARKGSLSWSIGNGPDVGSVFFDSILAGLKDSAADQQGVQLVDEDGKTVVHGSLVRLGALNTFVTNRFDDLRTQINLGKIHLPDNADLNRPVMGPVISEDTSAGGFFFLSNPYVEPQFAQTWNALGSTVQSFALGTRHVSGITTTSGAGKSTTLKVFLAPTSYKIGGIDISHFNGTADWPAIKADHVRFAYVKATQGDALVDTQFQKNWAGAKSVGIARGAYHFVDLCKSVDSQFSHITATVPKEEAALPFALDVEPLMTKAGPSFSRYGQAGCAATSLEDARTKLLDLANRLTTFYGKTTVIFGVPAAFQTLVDDRFSSLSIWMQQTRPGASDVNLPGKAPWTFWQHSNTGAVKGIKGPVDRDVFFGDEKAFSDFVAGRARVAANAALAIN